MTHVRSIDPSLAGPPRSDAPRRDGGGSAVGALTGGPDHDESAINTLHAFMLRHQMILGGSGALGYTFTESGTIDTDPLALDDARRVGRRLLELYWLTHGS